jgi:hypothetical protein
MTPVPAWPFLIARGRRRGYSVLAAPGFLLRDREEGYLEEVVAPSRGAVATREVTTPSGRRLYLVWVDHRVRGDELGEPTDPLDEHSRPLRLLYGLVCGHAVVPATADLDRSRAAMLATYRRFLHDEEAFTVEEAAPSQVDAPPRPSSRPRSTPEPTPEPRRGRGRRRLPVLAGAFATLLVVLAGLWWFAGRSEPPAERAVTPGTTVTGTIAEAGGRDTYLLDTGTATRLTLTGARPANLDVELTEADTGAPLMPRHGRWTVAAHTRYRLTVTATAGDYTFRLVAARARP